MARELALTPRRPVAASPCGRACRPRPKSPRLKPLLVLTLATIPAIAIPTVSAGASADSPRRQGAIGMPDPHTGSLLVAYYDTFLRDQNLSTFRQKVLGRYMEGTLARLSDDGDTQTRRAAVFALGLVGSYQLNPTVARALRDPDPTVRSLAENALWAIWFRADTAENNAALELVSLLIGHQEYRKAALAATRLIEHAPRFSEAYNQRAIAEYHLGQFQASAEDCRLVLEHNPYHIGALAGLAKCLLRLDRRDEAIETLRRSSRLQPYNEELKNFISALESGDP
jgi:tetratricopeptide (TPR) repeat protein